MNGESPMVAKKDPWLHRKRKVATRRSTRAPRRPRAKSESSPLDIARAELASRYVQLVVNGGKVDPSEREPPFVVIGTADVGQLHYCDAKATYAQTEMEEAFALRMLAIMRANDPTPDFVKASPEILALEILPPKEADSLRRQLRENSADYEVAEAEVARGTWHVGYAAAFGGPNFGLPAESTVYLAGILDGARSDGTVLEVRKTAWEFQGIINQGVNFEKETQANIYAVMLGMPRWECAFSCKDGIFKTEGVADREKALSEIGHAARIRWGLEKPRGVCPRTLWKCRSKRNECQFLKRCEVTPIPLGER